MFNTNQLAQQFSDANPRFIAYRETPNGREPVGSSNNQLQAWSMAESAATGPEATIFDKLGNFGNGTLRTRLRLTPAELQQMIKR